jgi:hypothetical protein
MSNPWTLVTGPVGAKGTPQSVPSVPVRRYCFDFPSTGNPAHGGFLFAYNVKNYVTQTGAPHQRLVAYRTAQGQVVLEGLIYALTPDTGILFYLPWDMLPYPETLRLVCLQNTGNQQGRSDIYYNSTYGWVYEVNSTAVTYQNQFTAVHAIYQTHVPVMWVDFGMKVSAQQGPGYTTIYTVGPGQISGYLKGAPLTVTFPAVQTVQLPYTPSGSNLTAWLYYDAAAGAFNHRVGNQGTFDVYPTPWIQMADRGQVVLAQHVMNYAASSYDPTSLMDHRWLLRGPLDVPSGTPGALI